MDSLIWNALNVWFKNNPALYSVFVILGLIIYGIYKFINSRTGKFKRDYDAKEKSRKSIAQIQDDVAEAKIHLEKINGSIQEHHSNLDCHFKKSEYEIARIQDKNELKEYFDKLLSVNLRSLELLVEMKKNPKVTKEKGV